MSIAIRRNSNLLHLGSLLFRQNDPFNNVYLNKGAYHDAIHFYQADPDPEEKKKKKKPSISEKVKRSFSKIIYRTYLLVWFSLYFSISMLVRLIR
jgi:hypothetical protein